MPSSTPKWLHRSYKSVSISMSMMILRVGRSPNIVCILCALHTLSARSSSSMHTHDWQGLEMDGKCEKTEI
jgi:hypothetical protein